ncbi:SGNH/GDSL hydrolase family protein [Mucilaginibacter jinjuensis]|uniref:GDSL-type esterase/lipase family protein n=1 Tax=Mucilaginibacter jinjuensis TaxID=1176721 RepID=A0ABY7T252_9SPHI|nr:SGNH/GDSL hydrolase family protein [Mucilaginibacter jinjuensis]WCT10406.1 GDSL-type esterase/lipase family protein [Mucilaginibacter jinjuensis]
MINSILKTIIILLVLVSAKAIAAAPGSLQDKHIKYIGRWDFSNSSEYFSYWGGAYIKVNFTGTTVKLRTGHKTNFFAKIDNGPWISFLNVGDTVNLSPTPLTNTTHTITVAQGKDYDYEFSFKGFLFDDKARTSELPVSKILVEYIGDSITAGYTDAQVNVSDYGWIAAEKSGVEHTQIAFPGICLVDGVKGVGMEVQYFKLKGAKTVTPEDWDFKRYTPRVIVINLGTNDNANKIPDSLFRERYIKFLKDIRTKFLDAQILVMRTFLGLKETPTLAAVNAQIAAGDKKIHFIDTKGWITVNTDDYNDGAHPSVSGQVKAGNKLAEVLAPYL